jgi:dTDP-glucose 4,6-dehydratase
MTLGQFTLRVSNKMKKIVYVTGCLGFIGYHVTRVCLEHGWYVRGIDSGTYAANKQFINELNRYPNFTFEGCDINDIERLYDCDYFINTAAETHVDNSIASSNVFLRSNINGVHHILELIKNSGRTMPTLLHFSTDEVYGDIEEGFHKETDLLKPSNPYSATKAAADMLVMAWARTYRVPYVIVRPTNNYGVGQYTEKFIPRAVKYLTVGKKIELHNEGTPRRTWLHVSDTARAVIAIIESGVKNEIYNISGNYETDNLTVAKKIVDRYSTTPVSDYSEYFDLGITRPGQDVRYAIDDTKLKALGWEPKADFDTELEQIVDYYSKTFVW